MTSMVTMIKNMSSDFGIDLDASVNLGMQALYTLRMEITFGLGLALISLLMRTVNVWASWASWASPPTKKVVGGKAATMRPRVPSSARLDRSKQGPEHGSGAAAAGDIQGDLIAMCRVQPLKALERYQAEVQKGLNFQDMPVSDHMQLVTELVLAAIRGGLSDQAIELLRDLQERGPGVTCALLASVVKMCTSKRSFAMGLQCYDLLVKDLPLQDVEKSVWSCLLFCALEVKAYDRCWLFFDRVKGSGPPSAKDLGNMVRAAAASGSMRKALDLCSDMRQMGHDLDTFVCNTLVAALVQEDWVEEAAALVKEVQDTAAVTDPITYNTLMKGFSRAQRIDRCFEIFEEMRSKGVVPSQVTYGILLDSCVNLDLTDKAADVFAIMKKEGCPMNTILYTTLMKGFARAGKLDQAMDVFKQMKESSTLDVITFSILIKANCDSGRLDDSLHLLDEMVKMGFQPDEVVFNNLLSGCANRGNVALGKRLYDDLLKLGLKPSTATFSIMLRLYTKCKLYDNAIDMLKREPVVHGIEVEERLYVQLFQTFARERQGRRCVEVFNLMCEQDKLSPSASLLSTLLKTCVKLNMFQTAVEILELAAFRGQKVHASDANVVLEGSLRKRKTSWARACLSSMFRLGVVPEPRLAEQARVMLEQE